MAAASSSTCFLGWGVDARGSFTCNGFYVRFYPAPSSRTLLPAYCKMRQRNFSFQNKRQHAKKTNLERQTNTNFQPNGDNDSDTNNSSKDSMFYSSNETASTDSITMTAESQHSNKKDYNDYSPSMEVTSLQDGTVDSTGEAAHSNKDTMGSPFPSSGITSLSTKADGEQLSGIHLQDLIGMIRNAEKNVHLLNQARIHALEDLEKIIDEKEALQGEINILDMKLAETDARLRVAAQEKIHVKLLEDQLEKLRNELSSRGSSMEQVRDMNALVSSSQVDVANYFCQELDLLRAENMSLKDELEELKAGLINIRETDERVQMLEEERSFLESSLKEFEFKLAASHEDVSKIASWAKSSYCFFNNYSRVFTIFLVCLILSATRVLFNL